MTKQDVVSKMAELAEGTKVEAEKWLNALLGTMESAMENKEKFNLVGYVSLEVVDRAERTGRNPQTGESIVIPAKQAVKAKVGKVLKDLANK